VTTHRSEFTGEQKKNGNTLPRDKTGPMLTASEKARMARITGDMTGENPIHRMAWEGLDPNNPPEGVTP
jgi:hypothetical protein